MDYVCKKQCFFRKRLWRPGMILAPLEGEVLPKFFVKKEELELKKEKKQTNPETLKDLALEEAKSILDAPGVGQAPKDDDFLS